MERPIDGTHVNRRKMTGLGAVARLRLSLKWKLGIAFSVVLVFLLLQGASSFYNALGVKQQFNQVTSAYQPAVLLSMELSQALDRANSALGFYLLGKDPSEKLGYEKSLGKLNEILTELAGAPVVEGDPVAKALVEEIAADVSRYAAYREQMLELATDREKNVISMTYSSQQITPFNSKIKQLLNRMVDSANEGGDWELLANFSDLRNSWGYVINEMRLFQAFRTPETKKYMGLYLNDVNEQIGHLNARIDSLSDVQAKAFGDFVKLKSRVAEKLDTLIEMHASEKWRTDSYLVRTEIGPLLNSANEKIGQLINHERALIDNANLGVDHLQEQSNWISISLIVVACVVLLVVAMVLGHYISTPIQKLVTSAEEIAKGNFHNQIASNSRDEIGELYHALNDMQSNLRRRTSTACSRRPRRCR